MTNLTSSAFSSRYRIIAYWATTALLVFERALGGVWDILRVPQVRGLIERLGYPLYFLVILWIWKLLGGVASLSASGLTEASSTGIFARSLQS